MAKGDSVPRDMMSLNTVFDKTPKTNSRRSSSHHSRKSTKEPESTKIKMAQTSYSLPPTPIASSFEESAPSTKRRKSQRPLDLKDSQPEKITKTPVRKKDDVLLQNLQVMPKSAVAVESQASRMATPRMRVTRKAIY